MNKKRLFFSACAVLPGGFILLAVLVVFSASCTHFKYEVQGTRDMAGVTVSGVVMSPENAMVAAAEAEAVRAEARVMRECGLDPAKCRAAELAQLGKLGVYGAGGGSYIASIYGGGAYAGFGTGAASAGVGEIRKDLADIKKTVKAVDKGQDAFFQALTARKKK